jgi:hypothetical protein
MDFPILLKHLRLHTQVLMKLFKPLHIYVLQMAGYIIPMLLNFLA